MRGTRVLQERTGKPRGLTGMLMSPIGKKVLTGITGLALVLFVIIHMLGNLSYFTSEGAYNVYADFLTQGTGKLIYIIELVLLAAFLLHAYLGVVIWLGKRRARKHGYAKYESAGGPSLQTNSSRTMIWTGVVLFIFTVIHLMTFKYGPGIEEGYIANAQGVAVSAAAAQETVTVGDEIYIRDIRRLVTEKFQHWYYTFGYTFVMLLLFWHLRHGVWSAFQSLGAMSPRLTPVFYTLGALLGLLIAVGFIVLPLYIFFFV